jgi:hypothetical protein
VRHLHDLHSLRAHYDLAEVAVLAREVMVADAEAYGNQFPAYRENPCARRCAPSKGLRLTRAMPDGMGNFSALWSMETMSSTPLVSGHSEISRHGSTPA